MEKQIQLTSQIVLQVLGEQEFYRECPTYLFMMDNGMAIAKQYRDLVANKQKCAGCTERAITATLATFAIHTRLCSRFDKRQLVPLVGYLQKKLGYEPAVVSLYYKDGVGKQKELRFGPKVPEYVQDVFVEQGGSHGPLHQAPPDAAGPGGGPQPSAGVPV